MPRRVPKPFIVEIRGSDRRKPTVATIRVDDQPRVEWPMMMLDIPPAEPVPAKPSGRILPALDVPPLSSEHLLRPKRQRVPRISMQVPQAAEVPNKIPEVDPELPTIPADPVSIPSLTEPVEAVPRMRNNRRHRPRRDFLRGDRWRSRLPDVVSRKRVPPPVMRTGDT